MTRRNERAFEREASENLIAGDTTLLDEPPVKHTQHFMGRRDRKTACGRTDLPRVSVSTTDHRAAVDCAACLEALARRRRTNGLEEEVLGVLGRTNQGGSR